MNNQELGDELREIRKDQTRILQILESDKRIRTKGLVERVSDVEAIVNSIMINNKARAMAAGFVGGLISAIAGVIAWFITNLK